MLFRGPSGQFSNCMALRKEFRGFELNYSSIEHEVSEQGSRSFEL